ncbi:MAG: hypothetical protein DME26_12575, partial [Verrucomicrobia bacterium]
MYRPLQPIRILFRRQPFQFESIPVSPYDARRCLTPISCVSLSVSPGAATARLRPTRWWARFW